MQTISGNWYDFPQYYDLAFRSDTKQEADFFEAAFEKHDLGPTRRILEPACGSGRLIVEMAARGYSMIGFDLSQPALNYLDRKLKRRRLSAQTFQGDMADFSIAEPVDAAFNLYSSFRHLLTEELAKSHLECVARSLRAGGVYILGLHVFPPDVDLEDSERWTEEYRGTKVTCTFKVLHCDLKRRQEQLRTSLAVRTPTRRIRVETEYPMRTYSARQLRSLLAKVPSFEIAGVYDYLFDVYDPVQLDEEIADTVLILRKL